MALERQTFAISIKDEVKMLAAKLAEADGTKLPAGISSRAIEAFARRTKLEVPPEFREWLRFSNGPRIGPGGVFGISTEDDFDDLEGRLEPIAHSGRRGGFLSQAMDVEIIMSSRSSRSTLHFGRSTS